MKRIAWFSPFDPEGETISGVFSCSILPELAKHFEIYRFNDHFDRTESATHFLQAAKMHRDNPFDLFIYQLENSPRLNFSRIHCGLIPGLTIFHHYNFINFGPEPILNSPWRNVVAKFIGQEQAWPERGAKFFQQGPQAIRESAWTLQALFTNPINISDYKNSSILKIADHYQLPALCLPFPACPALEPVSKNERFTIAFAGRALIQDRVHKILKVLKTIPDVQFTWMIDAEDEFACRELLNEFSVEAEFVKGRNIANWSRIVSRADVALHTQFTVFDQPAPFLQASLIAGRPIIVNDFGFADSLPDDIVFKISNGDCESAELQMLLLKLKESDLTVLSQRVQEYASRNYASLSVASDLAEIINKYQPVYSRFYSDWRNFTNWARLDLLSEADADFEKNFDSIGINLRTHNILSTVRQELGL